MSTTRYNPAAQKPLTPPRADTILGEAEYRGFRIVCTNDPNFCANHVDSWGFKPPCVYVVLDELDDVVFPPGMAAFYTPDDAAVAIEMRETCMAEIKARQPCTTLQYEYGTMRQYRRAWWAVYLCIIRLQGIVDDARALGDNPIDDISKELHALHQRARNSRDIG